MTWLVWKKRNKISKYATALKPSDWYVPSVFFVTGLLLPMVITVAHCTTNYPTASVCMNTSLPESLYTAEQVRQLDHAAIHQAGIAGFELMSRAASAVMQALSRHWPKAKTVLVLCGAGNNGGDGYLVARLAKEHELQVSVLSCCDPARLTGDARTAWQACLDAGVVVRPYDVRQSLAADVVVDAMLGTGLTGAVRGDCADAIRRLNHLRTAVCAVDIPSGLCADTGVALGEAVRATLTVSFIGLKTGLLTGQGPEYCGQLLFDDLGVPSSVCESLPGHCRRIAPGQFRGWLARRSRVAHKGNFGHLLLIGGNEGMPGAILLAAESALHCGAGLVTVATRKHHLTALAVRCPEVMGVAVKTASGLGSLADGKSAIVIGPGLGRDDWGLKLLQDALAAPCPVVLDADALNLLSHHPQLLNTRKSPMIFTPHPGELARLTGQSIAAIERDRPAALLSGHRQLMVDAIGHHPGIVTEKEYDTGDRKYECNVVLLLKGAGTLIYDGHKIALCSEGNPGMAVAGMGDVLSGVTGALLAQGLTPFRAARMAAWLHASAADELAASQGETGLRASELIPAIRQRLNCVVG